MDFLLAHWHCILPISLFLVGYLIYNWHNKKNPHSNISDRTDFNAIATLEKKFKNGEITEADYLRKRALLD